MTREQQRIQALEDQIKYLEMEKANFKKRRHCCRGRTNRYAVLKHLLGIVPDYAVV